MTLTLSTSLDARWIEEATRVYGRYQREVVEAFGLCPWAEPSRRLGKMRERILLQRDESVAPTIDTMSELATDPTVEVAVLIYPRLVLPPTGFDRFVARVRDVDAASHELGTIPFAMAAFHPDAPLDQREPERLIPFLRRTPDPTIQVVRSSVLERVRSGAPQGTSFVNPSTTFHLNLVVQLPLRERIARANHAKVETIGIDELRRRLAAIRDDRNASYAAMGA